MSESDNHQNEITQSLIKEPIAIVGIGCRFPGEVNNPQDFWELLKNGDCVITEVPADRWKTEAFYDEEKELPGKMYTRYGGFISNIDQFDPYFFGISPKGSRIYGSATAFTSGDCMGSV